MVTFGIAGGIGGSFSPSTCTISSGGYCFTQYTPSTSLGVGTYNNDITASFAAVGNYNSATAAGNFIMTKGSQQFSSTIGYGYTTYGAGGEAVFVVSSKAEGSVVTLSALSPVTGSFPYGNTCTISSGSCDIYFIQSATLARGTYTNDMSGAFAATSNYNATTTLTTLVVE